MIMKFLNIFLVLIIGQLGLHAQWADPGIPVTDVNPFISHANARLTLNSTMVSTARPGLIFTSGVTIGSESEFVYNVARAAFEMSGVNSGTVFDFDLDLPALTAFSPGAFRIGPEQGLRMDFDQNDIQAKNTNGAATLYLNDYGGNVEIGTGGGIYYNFVSEKVGIGNLSPNYELDVYGRANISGELTAASDLKLKRNITKISNATSILSKLNPVTYEFRDNEFPTMQLSEGQRWGLIAQEVEQILPELVSESSMAIDTLGNEQSIKSLNYIDLIPILIKSIQEQELRIQELERQLRDK